MGAVNIGGLAAAVTEELEGYRREVADGLKEEVRRAAKEAAADIRAAAPKDSGEYARGWTSKTVYEDGGDIRVRVYNRKKPQLTHLLEHGHAKRGGGRVEGKPHIGPAARDAEKKLDSRVKVVVKG